MTEPIEERKQKELSVERRTELHATW